MPPRSTLGPLECSDGTKPSQAVSCRGLAKRRKSPTSAASTTAERKATPRIACKAATTGASDQPGTSSPDPRLQAVAAALGLVDGVELLLQHDLLGGVLEA